MKDTAEQLPRNATVHTKIRGSTTKTSIDDDHADRHIPRRTRTHSYSSRRSLLCRLDTWLSSFIPAVVRPWLLGIPSMLLLYCILSVLVLSGHLVSGYRSRYPTPQTDKREVSPLEQLPLDHLFTKVSSLRPLLLDSNVLSTQNDATPYAACLWTTDADLDVISTWATRWTGPTSLVITTVAAPASPQHEALLDTLAQVQNNNPSLKKTLFAHVLHLDSSTDTTPNAFLNLARLLSPSPRVVLFPGNLSYVPPKNLYRALVSQQSPSSSAVSSLGSPRKRKPLVLTVREHTSFPFAPFAPLVIARDDSTWCTERFFTGLSRSVDWEACLWQVWLANFGDLEIRQIQGWTISDVVVEPATYPAMAKVHHRLASKFRSETCALAIRRFAALRDVGSSSDTRKARWLKRVCRSWGSA